MRARGVIPGSSGFPVRWFGGFAVVELPADGGFLTPPALAGELCAVLDAGAAGLIADLPGAGVCDSACLDALMRAARRARGWEAWLRLVVRDPGARRVVRLVALDGLMPVHASVTGAVQAATREAAAREAATGAAGGGPAIGLALSDAGAEVGVDLLTVSVSAREGYTLVSLDGEADVTVRGTLHAALTAQMSAETAHLVVDLTRLAYIDASCVQVLWRVSRMAEGADGRLGLAAPQPLVARVMELWGVGQVIGVHESVAEAVIAAAR